MTQRENLYKRDCKKAEGDFRQLFSLHSEKHFIKLVIIDRDPPNAVFKAFMPLSGVKVC